MKCWKCGKEGASVINPRDVFIFDPKTDITIERERIKGIRSREENSQINPRYFCSKCYQDYTAELSEQRKEYAKLKKVLMLERAVRLLERQALDIYEYKDIIDQMRDYVEEQPEKFESSHEMIAAIILVSSGIKIKSQYKILKYRVDFLVPVLKVVLEIDGDLHKLNTLRDNKRDIDIREELGKEWETVRIGTKYLEQNAPALVEAIIAVRNEKKRLREKHHGYLPDWYYVRDKSKRKQRAVGDDELLNI